MDYIGEPVKVKHNPTIYNNIVARYYSIRNIFKSTKKLLHLPQKQVYPQGMISPNQLVKQYQSQL